MHKEGHQERGVPSKTMAVDTDKRAERLYTCSTGSAKEAYLTDKQQEVNFN